MKKTILVLLALTMLLTAAGCGPFGKTSSVTTGTKEIESCKTIGDVLALKGAEEDQHGYMNDEYYYVFILNETYYRVTAALTEEASDALRDLDYFDDEYDAKYDAIISPLSIVKYENLSERIPSREKLNKLVGKTGGELVDGGWYAYIYNSGSAIVWMDFDPFSYIVTFDGTIEYDPDDETFDIDEAIRDLKVKSLEFDELGDATDPAWEEEYKWIW